MPGSDTLSAVMQLLSTAHVHQVHIVDGARRPVGVVSTVDVLRVLLTSEREVHAGALERGPMKIHVHLHDIALAPHE